MNAKPERKRRGFWGTCRVYFRRFRIAIWLAVLVVLGCFLYVNQVGLPQFVKGPLLQRLHDQGLDLQFSRLRLRWYEGIVAEDVRFGQPGAADRPRLEARDVEVGVSWKALTHLQLQVDHLLLRHGRLGWRIPEDPAGRELSVENIQTYLRFLPGDRWALDRFSADFANARIQLSGAVTNASAMSQWRFFQGGQAEAASAALWQNRLRRLADTLDRIHFPSQPELRLQVHGDALVLSSFTVRIALAAPGADTPWGTIAGGHFTARLFAADTNGTSHADLRIDAANAQTRWASLTNFQMEIRLASAAAQTNLIIGELNLSAEVAETRWARSRDIAFAAEWTHSITNPIPLSGQGNLTCAAAATKWGEARQFKLTSRLGTPDLATLPDFDPGWAGWTNIRPFALDWECSLQELNSDKGRARDILCAGTWRAPGLKVTNLSATLYEGRLDATADLDVATRRLDASLKTSFEPQQAAAALGGSARDWVDQFRWNSVPHAEGRLSLTLPAWTNQAPDWRAEVQPTAVLNGFLELESGGSYRQVQVTSLRSHFAYSNMTWHLPDLALARPEGRVLAEHRANERTGEFYWRLDSDIDPRALQPLVDPDGQKGLEILHLTRAPRIEAEVWGRAHEPDRIGVKGRVALTNFSFRGESIGELRTEVQYTNKVLQFLQPRIRRGKHGEQDVRADSVTADFNRQFVYLSNGFSTAEPMVVARAIGAKIGRAIQPYTFSNPPTAHVEGIIPMHGEEGADLRFQLEGGPFHWWKFNTPWIRGVVHWKGLSLALKDVQAKFYRGEAVGAANFQFVEGKGADFTCALVVTNALLQELMADISSGTNRLEGMLNGTLNFTKANTEDWNALFGYGEVKLRDGLIWDIPLFGIFTPVLEGISPGLGHTRASAGTCTYFITNGVIRTDDLEIRSPALRLQYRGSVDLQSRVNARVEAELLRDMWLVGPLVSTVLWPVTKMFEYRVTGTLGEPKTEPVYVFPKIMNFPFHPLRTLKSLLPEDPSSRTNAPPVFKQIP